MTDPAFDKGTEEAERGRSIQLSGEPRLAPIIKHLKVTLSFSQSNHA
ncbi:hypothetical protein JOE56_001851 [Brevibacterium paucivorans]|uniref:Uncharacterized protein n=1 Tax=Brevibacterium paucivorans TaxID=170994 RepID=A0ABS2SLM0_9MICO|nr:hypothetical protein [Brevibacterium paucivorans]